MKKIMITCPECKHEFSPDESLKHQLDHLMREEKAALAANFAEKEKALAVANKELTQRENSVNLLVDEKLKSEKLKLKSELEKSVRGDFSVELEGLRKELEEKQGKLNKAKVLEIEIERIKRETKEREDALRLTYEKELSSERSKIESAIVEREAQRNEMKLAERDKQLSVLESNLKKQDAKQSKVLCKHKAKSKNWPCKNYYRIYLSLILSKKLL